MKKRVLNIRRRLEQIYKGNECCDISDVETALKEVRVLQSLNDGYQTPAIRNRIRSLETRLKELK